MHSVSAFLADFRLFLVLGRPSPWDCIMRSCAQIDVNVVEVTDDVLVLPERGHDVLLRRADILAASGDDA